MGVSLHKRNRRGKRAIHSDINVTPLVDVMLVLLVIFMVTSPMLVAGVQVDLPKTKASALAGQDEPVSVSIDKFGAIYIGEMKVKLTEVAAKIKAVSKENNNVRVFVRGDKAIDYGRVMEVFGAIKAGGFQNIALVSEHLND